MIAPQAYSSLPAALYLASLVFLSLQFSHPAIFFYLYPLLLLSFPPLHLNAFGSVALPPYCAKVFFLTAHCHLSLLFLLVPSLHFTSVYFFLPLVHETYLGHMRGPVSGVSNERTQMGMLFSRWVTRKRGQCHCHIDVPTNVVVRPSRALHFSSTPASFSWVREPLAIWWQGRQLQSWHLRALCSPCWPFPVTPQWRLAVWCLGGYVLAAIWESCLIDELLPFSFYGQTWSSEGPLYDVTKVLMPLQLRNANKVVQSLKKLKHFIRNVSNHHLAQV